MHTVAAVAMNKNYIKSSLMLFVTRIINYNLIQSCPRVGWTRGSGHEFAGFCRVGSELQVLHFATDLIITCFQNRYESLILLF
jgi:hypothetical protein